ncbi:MAG: Hsp20/alpha crystallin family protein [Anaerolineae bacterium]|nr:Hsp20/alpha crystallin family protein [Anaerolineae bacterium]
MNKMMRWDPMREAMELRRTFDRLFLDSQNGGSSRPFVARPALDVIEHEDHLIARLDLPGVAPENVNVEIKEGVLTISTEVSSDETHEQANYAYRERYQGSYQRQLRLSDAIDTESVNASFENGVLTLTLPKKPEAQPIRIPVKGSSVVDAKK